METTTSCFDGIRTSSMPRPFFPSRLKCFRRRKITSSSTLSTLQDTHNDSMCVHIYEMSLYTIRYQKCTGNFSTWDAGLLDVSAKGLSEVLVADEMRRVLREAVNQVSLHPLHKLEAELAQTPENADVDTIVTQTKKYNATTNQRSKVERSACWKLTLRSQLFRGFRCARSRPCGTPWSSHPRSSYRYNHHNHHKNNNKSIKIVT